MSLPHTYLAECAEPTGYLDFARFGPPTRRVVATTARLTDLAAAAGPSTVDDLMREVGAAQRLAARLTGIAQVTLLPNTSTGLFQAATAIDGPVLVSATDFPANTYPWARVGTARPLRAATPEAVREALTADVRAVAVSAVDFRTGRRADLAGLREVIGDRLLVVDGIQGFGAVDMPWAAADVLVVGGQKWLRAGWSTGFLALPDAALDRLEPVLSGWTGARDHTVFDDVVHPRADGAAGWSITNLSPIAAGALAAALDLLAGVGADAVERAVLERVDALADVVARHGGRVVSTPGSGILAFAHPAPGVGEALRAAGVTATTRADHVRLSPHASTTAATIEAVADALGHLRG
ncbi:aminotransferase class V-fold PLP-dependent enzyme [Actinosynnema sp. NPDC020468]|uniref:aminotransferase class V-fold PLP-dependent enzyme n=1 Tax=Actinosynnema sp. NPDC020468 TaxID=3154488 RepID=UPI0033D0C657